MFRAGILNAEQAPVPVVSVGNILIGGSGKTPFVIYLARLLKNQGLRPAVISRGYRGSNREPYLVVGDGAGEPFAGPSAAGDEPYLMAKRLFGVPVLVGRRRIDPVKAAARLFDIAVAILDDGFQHLALERSADIVLITGAEEHMFPLGQLREPRSALRRADILVLSGDEASMPDSVRKYVEDRPVFRCRTLPAGLVKADSDIMPVDCLAGSKVVLVSAIANPHRFLAVAERLQWDVAEHRVYPDHYTLTDEELSWILSRSQGAPIVVTEKDWVKLPGWFTDSGTVYALRIETVLDGEEQFLQDLMELLKNRTGDHS